MHPSRVLRNTTAAAAGVALVCTSIASSATASEDAEPDSAGNAASAPAEGKVRFGLPTWTVKGGKHETTVRVRYPSSDPRSDWDHQPVKIQVRDGDGSWTTVGSAKQKPRPGKKASRTQMTYKLPDHGKTVIRAKAYSTDSSIGSKDRKLTVAEDAAYAPTGVPGSRWDCFSPGIGRNPSKIGYTCTPGEYEYNTWRTSMGTGERKPLAPYSAYPNFATDANVAIVDTINYYDEDYWHERVRRINLNTNKSSFVAFKLNGERARIAKHSSVSGNGKRVAYASPTPGIVRHAKKGPKVYVARAGTKKSRLVGRGDRSDISASGRYVAWRNPAGMVRLRDLRTGRKTAVTKRKGHNPQYIEVSGGGRYVSFSAVTNDRSRVRIYDTKTSTLRTVAPGRVPTISDNGRYVAYAGPGKHELYLWNRTTGKKRLITVGPSGEGSGARMFEPDISPNGRWIVADTSSPKVAPDNGRGYAKNEIILFDRKARN